MRPFGALNGLVRRGAFTEDPIFLRSKVLGPFLFIPGATAFAFKLPLALPSSGFRPAVVKL